MVDDSGKFETEKKNQRNKKKKLLFIEWPDEIQTLAIWTDSMCGLHNENTLSHTNYLPFALAEWGSGYGNFVILR